MEMNMNMVMEWSELGFGLVRNCNTLCLLPTDRQFGGSDDDSFFVCLGFSLAFWLFWSRFSRTDVKFYIMYRYKKV